MIGKKLAEKMFGIENPVGRNIQIEHDLYRVIGILGGIRVSDRDRLLFLPITTARDRVSGISFPNKLYIRCKTLQDVKPVAKAIPNILKITQHSNAIDMTVSWALLRRIIKIVFFIEFFIYLSIAAVFILGGFGIWNIMMNMVFDRTKEIGLKKAMGAQDSDILKEFMMEDLIITLGAAFTGIIIGRFVIELLKITFKVAPPDMKLFLFASGMGLLITLVLGVTAGVYPAIRASKMEVSMAMRYE